MPMDFPDHCSLERAANVWGFRFPRDGETDDAYRTALADFVHQQDSIEAHEIRTGLGWDRWSDAQKKTLLRLQGFPV